LSDDHDAGRSRPVEPQRGYGSPRSRCEPDWLARADPVLYVNTSYASRTARSTHRAHGTGRSWNNAHHLGPMPDWPVVSGHSPGADRRGPRWPPGAALFRSSVSGRRLDRVREEGVRFARKWLRWITPGLDAYDRDVTTTRDEALTDLERAGRLVEQRVSTEGSFKGWGGEMCFATSGPTRDWSGQCSKAARRAERQV
jgi:hypothetical protein